MTGARSGARGPTASPALALLLIGVLAGLAAGCGRMLVGRVPQNDAGDTPDHPDGGGDSQSSSTGGSGGGGRAGDGGDARDTADAADAPPAADARASGGGDSGGDASALDAADARDSADAPDTADARDAAGDGTAPGDTSAPSPIGIIAGRITMSTADNIAVRGAGVAGVAVSLSGPAARSAISDANGAYQFPGLPPGTYAVAVAKDGATFTPPSTTGLVVGNDGAGVVAGFACTAPCGTGPVIDPSRELFVQDPTVLGDNRARNDLDGVWSFRYLMEQVATTPANAYANAWIDNLASTGRSVTRLRMQWLTVSDGVQTLPDLSRAPFQLLAIVNGVDTHATGQGELRFLYGIYDVLGAPTFNPQSRTFTVMFTYALPATMALPTRQAWARAFHDLGAIPFGADYNAALEALTTVATRAGAQMSNVDNPRGSALVSLGINEAFGNTPFQMRQFRPLPDPQRGYPLLVVSPLLQTPDSSLSALAGPLPDLLNANPALFQAGFAYALLPVALLATQSSAFATGVSWAFPSVNNEALRHAFAGQTCIGCHSSEVPAVGNFHVYPYGGATTASRSDWVTTVEIPRRTSFLQNQVTCSGATCALGAEPMMGPAR